MLFFESGDTEVLKLIEISCLQVIKGKLTVRLTIRLLDMLHSYMSVMCTYHCRGVFKKNVISRNISLVKRKCGTSHVPCTRVMLPWGRQ